jgi:hypothetical protein
MRSTTRPLPLRVQVLTGTRPGVTTGQA